MYMNWRIN